MDKRWKASLWLKQIVEEALHVLGRTKVSFLCIIVKVGLTTHFLL